MSPVKEPPTLVSPDHRAAAVWLALTEYGDVDARTLIAKHGYSGALAAIHSMTNPPERWVSRLERVSDSDIDTWFTPRPICGTVYQPQLLIPTDPAWPDTLTDLDGDAPLALWCLGNVEALNRGGVAIVGARAASPRGAQIAHDWASELAPAFPIISGGAFGIDSAAHQGALDAGGSTIVVLAGGIDHWYPRVHAQLFHTIIRSGGAIITEAPIGGAPQRHRFLSRNRIIAGLAHVTVVVEAAYRSGALSTARHAASYGREVAAVPHSVDAITGAGCLDLIRDGAVLVRTPADVRELLGEARTPDLFDASLSARHLRVLDAVPVRTGASTASIACVAGMPMAEVAALLMDLTNLGRIEFAPSGWRLMPTRAAAG